MKEFSTFIYDVIEEKRIIEWTTVMEWFVETVIGLDSRWKMNDWRSSLTTNDVLIDETETIRLKAADPDSSPSFPPSFSGDLNTVCDLILEELDTLWDCECLNFPPPIQSIVANVITSTISHFVESGDLVLLPNVTLDSVRSFFCEVYHEVDDEYQPYWLYPHIIIPFIAHHVANSHLVAVANPPAIFTLPDRTPSEELWRTVNSILNSSSHRYNVEALSGFEEWLEMMRQCVEKSEVFNDFSFLRMPFFKRTLLCLQSKFQNIAQLSLHSNQLSPNPNMISSSEPSLDWSTTAPSLAIQSSFSLNTAHLSDPTTNQSELDDGSERSDVSLSNQPSSSTSFSSLPSKQETLQILTVLHSLITAPLSPSLEPSNPPPPFLLRPLHALKIVPTTSRQIAWRQYEGKLEREESPDGTSSHATRCVSQAKLKSEKDTSLSLVYFDIAMCITEDNVDQETIKQRYISIFKSELYGRIRLHSHRKSAICASETPIFTSRGDTTPHVGHECSRKQEKLETDHEALIREQNECQKTQQLLHMQEQARQADKTKIQALETQLSAALEEIRRLTDAADTQRDVPRSVDPTTSVMPSFVFTNPSHFCVNNIDFTRTEVGEDEDGDSAMSNER
ncbi:hypothetical protein BLNAU_10869 [Blattamonas nauphoetae]|uniref:Uncharacterized protein n=1 Tax=Blattamonas nauphoetae TaxID=2049346 RepID=A0ABQ9XQY8_9EUKA|nr:hypothetical protein BLNAU_10869 [Blattamonas nauphoetae]